MDGSAAPAKLQPALLAGIAIGVLSALPIVNLLNFCCCGWVLIGGALAAYLMQQNHVTPIDIGDGAIVGLLAGVVGAIVGSLLAVPLALTVGTSPAQVFEQALERAQDMPPEVRSILEYFSSRAALSVLLTVNAVLMLIVGSIFGLIGGAIGAVLFRKNLPHVPPPPPPLPPVPTV